MKAKDTEIIQLKSAIRRQRKWLRDVRNWPAPSSQGLTRKERKQYGNKPVPLPQDAEDKGVWELNTLHQALRICRNERRAQLLQRA